MNMSQPRLEKAFDLLDNIFGITSSTAMVMSNGNIYRVNYKNKTCNCDDNLFRGIPCKHLYAVLIKTGNMKVDKA